MSHTERSIFLSAIDIPSGTPRREYLEAACQADSGLRARVEDLLQEHHAGGGPLDRPPVDLELSALHPVLIPAERIGDCLGPYRLLQQIGEGGFGSVYLAEQVEPISRQVALKVVKPGMATQEVLARFEVERQALALMDHPNIANILDGGSTPAGQPYFVMELVRGAPLTTFCDDARLTPRARLELFLDVCRAVQHAHSKGIVHRDLKPSNILVTLHDGRPVPKVIDFGIARGLARPLAAKTLRTAQGQLLGTPKYMSPEQADLCGDDIDHRTDIYSLGVLLYELLTGVTPLEAESLRGKDYQELRELLREHEPPPPSRALARFGSDSAEIAARRGTETRKLIATLRGELDWIVLKALERDRERRYASAGALAGDLERYLAGEAVSACPPAPGYRLKKFVRRHQLATALTAVVLWVLAAGLTVHHYFALSPRPLQRPGDLDVAFGHGGKVATDFGGDELVSGGLVLGLPRGDVLVCGSSLTGPTPIVARFRSDGSLDPYYGSARGPLSPPGMTVRTALAQADGSVLLAGATDEGAALLRLLPSGRPDVSFGPDGRQTPLLSEPADPAAVLALQPDGKIVTGGFTLDGNGRLRSRFVLHRWDRQFRLDPDFRNEAGEEPGTVRIGFGPRDLPQTLLVLPSGRMVIGGTLERQGQTDFVVLGLLPDGRQDESFGTHGWADIDMDVRDELADIAWQPDGGLLLVGSTGVAESSDFAVARLTVDGRLDGSFGRGGCQRLDFNGGWDAAYAVALQPDGKILVAGSAFVESNDFAVARLTPDGELDRTFHRTGLQTIDFFGSGEEAHCVAYIPGGRILLAGHAFTGRGWDFALARLHAGPLTSPSSR